MANTKSAKKRIRQTKRRTVENRQYRVTARTFVKKARQLMAEGNVEGAEAAANQAYKTLDKAARKNVIHPRNAARRKGRLMAALSAAKASTNA